MTTTILDLGPVQVDLLNLRAGDRNLISTQLLAKGSPVDLTGAVLSAQARAKVTDPDPAALTALVTVTDATDGAFTMEWDGEEIRDLLAERAKWAGVWDLQAVTDGAPNTLAAGKFTAVMDVTR